MVVESWSRRAGELSMELPFGKRKDALELGCTTMSALNATELYA